MVREIQRRILSIKKAVHDMTEARKVANHLGSQVEKAFSYEEKVRPYLEEIREHIDSLELEIDDEIWPLPNYYSRNKVKGRAISLFPLFF